jgi:hypothetical protein
VSAQKRRAKRLRQAGTALGGVVLVAAVAIGAQALWERRPVVAPQPIVAEPVPTTVAPNASEVASSAPEPTTSPETEAPKPIPHPLNPGLRTGLGARLANRPNRVVAVPPAPVDNTTYEQKFVVETWADVAVDGKPTLTGVKSGTLPLTLGHHVLTFSATGRKPETREVEINAMNNLDLRLKLTPMPARLRVTANPPDANVMVDNQSYGSAQHSPFLINLGDNPTPTVDVDVIKSGYAPFHTRVNLRADQEQPITANLKPEGTP